MAKLIVPTFAVRGPCSNGKINGKWHLLKMTGMYAGCSVCKRYCDEWIKISIAELKPEDICLKCLGPLEVKRGK